MNPASRRLVLAALVACAVLLSGCTGRGNAARNAATVDGHPITNAQLQATLPLLQFLASVSQATCGGVTQGSESVKEAACVREVLSVLIQEQVIDAYADEHDIKPPPDGAASTIAAITGQLGGEEGFKKALADAHVTEVQLRSFMDRLGVFSAVRDDVAVGKVPEEELKADYQQNQASFTQLHVQHVLVKSKAEAEKILAQATPANFSDLAKKYSIDPSAADNGGDIQSTADGLVDPFVQAVLAAKPGEIIGPVKTQFGYHVIHVISVDKIPFDQAKTQLLSSRAQPIFQEWLTKQLTDAHITVNPRYGTFDPTTGQVVEITSTSSVSPGRPAGSTSPSSAGPAVPTSP